MTDGFLQFLQQPLFARQESIHVLQTAAELAPPNRESFSSSPPGPHLVAEGHGDVLTCLLLDGVQEQSLAVLLVHHLHILQNAQHSQEIGREFRRICGETELLV